MTKPRVPPELGKHGAAFWRQVQKAYELDARDAPVLLETCRVLDEIEALRVTVERDGVLSTGSAGQVVEHPALAGMRAHRTLLDRLLVRLALPSEEGSTPDSVAQIRARKAATSRWRGHVPRDAGTA